MIKDYYKILEIEENASENEIKNAYRKLSKKYHPDVNPDGEENFKEISTAYETLGDKNKRAQYDHSRKNPYSGTQFEDIFSQMFGDNLRRQRGKSAPDKIIRTQISPLESYFGSEKVLSYIREHMCSPCKGTGGDQQTCHTCNGHGFQTKTFGTGFMTQQIRTMCPTCAGKGYTLVHKCYNCDGRGVKAEASQVSIKLPVGADSGQFLKLENLGDFKNGEYGDLVIQVELVPKDGYEKINNDLIYNLFLNLEEIQQDKFIIPHPDGDLNMIAPKTFDTSKPLRLRAKGYPGGDMYVKFNVRFERSV